MFANRTWREMALKISESDLLKHGLEIDPANPNVIVPQDPEKTARPDDTWDIDRLGRYVTAKIADADRFEKEASHLSRRSTVEVYRAGQALLIVRNRLKSEGIWCEWQQQHKIPRTTAWEAILLFQRAKSEEEVAHLTRWQAKTRYGITSGPVRKAAVTNRDACPIPAPNRRQLTAFSPDEDHQYPVSCNDCASEDDIPELPEIEDTASLLTGLMRIADWLAQHKDAVEGIDWAVNSPADHLRVLEQIDEFLWQVKRGITGEE